MPTMFKQPKGDSVWSDNAQMSNPSCGPGGRNNINPVDSLMNDPDPWVLATHDHEHPADPSSALWGDGVAGDSAGKSGEVEVKMVDNKEDEDYDEDEELYADILESATETTGSVPPEIDDQGSRMLIDDGGLGFTGWDGARDPAPWLEVITPRPERTPRPELDAVVSVLTDELLDKHEKKY